MTSGGGNDVSASVNRKDQSVIGSEKLYREATISNGEGSLNFVKVQIAEVFRVMVLTSDALRLRIKITKKNKHPDRRDSQHLQH